MNYPDLSTSGLPQCQFLTGKGLLQLKIWTLRFNMKSIRVILMFLFTLSSCGVQENSVNIRRINRKIEYLNSERKTINLQKIEDYKRALGNERFLRQEHKKTDERKNAPIGQVVISEVNKVYDGYLFVEFDGKGKKIKEIKTSSNSPIIDVKENIDLYFDYYETYFSNGNISTKSIKSWLGFNINKIYNYSASGELVSVIDTDEGYDFRYDDILRFCKEKQISLETKSFPIHINKITRPDGLKTWVITYANEKFHKIEIYVINGSNGEVSKHDFEPWPGFVHID
jgi:hypothetical protein